MAGREGQEGRPPRLYSESERTPQARSYAEDLARRHELLQREYLAGHRIAEGRRIGPVAQAPYRC